MGKIIETKVTRFDGGIVNDARDPRENIATAITNFDILTSPYKMVPYRSSEAGDSAPTTSVKKNFAMAIKTGTTWALYALGKQSANAKAEVLFKNISGSGSNSLIDNGWDNVSNNTQSSGTTANYDTFVYFKTAGRIYSTRDSRYIQAFDPTGSAAWADAKDLGSTFTTATQGLVHSKDNILYIGFDNKIIASDVGAGTWTDTLASPSLTLPDWLYITSIAEYGDYLAIACAPIDGANTNPGNSRVFLWDRDSTLATVDESIDWGIGALKVLHEVDGALIGISLKDGVADFSGSGGREKIIFRVLSANKALKFLELSHDGSGKLALPTPKQLVDNRLYFMMRYKVNGTQRDGLWSIGRSLTTGQFVLVHERTPDNDTAMSNNDNALHNFIVVGDYAFIAYTDGGNAHDVSKTDDTNAYLATSIWESKKFTVGEPSLEKKLLGVSVFTEPLPTSATITLAYKKDADTSFTTIFSRTVDDANDADYQLMSIDAVTIESSGATLPRFHDIQFKITVTGAQAVVTGLSFKAEVIEKRPY